MSWKTFFWTAPLSWTRTPKERASALELMQEICMRLHLQRSRDPKSSKKWGGKPMRSEGEENSNFSGNLSKIQGRKKTRRNSGILRAFRYLFKKVKWIQNSSQNCNIKFEINIWNLLIYGVFWPYQSRSSPSWSKVLLRMLPITAWTVIGEARL